MAEEWSDRIRRIANIHNDAEYEMVKQRKRRAGTFHINPFNYDVSMERIQKDGLVWLPIQRSKNYGGFSHKHFPTSPDDVNSSVYGVLAANLDDAELFRQASSYRTSEPTDHEVIGELLGFPSCCTKFFTDIWPKYYDPIWQSALNTDGVEIISDTHVRVRGDYRIYQHIRYNGLRVTSHLPCSYSCQESIDVADIWIDVMMGMDEDATKDLLTLISMPSKWTCYRGIAQIEHPVFIVVTNSMPTSKKYTIDFVPQK